uniref:Uncharacterized protein n=1 Tax=Cacopsylla melanoneura TaxID=428564 RepID=A0A8D8QAF9_9HEMI
MSQLQIPALSTMWKGMVVLLVRRVTESRKLLNPHPPRSPVVTGRDQCQPRLRIPSVQVPIQAAALRMMFLLARRLRPTRAGSQTFVCAISISMLLGDER